MPVNTILSNFSFFIGSVSFPKLKSSGSDRIVFLFVIVALYWHYKSANLRISNHTSHLLLETAAGAEIKNSDKLQKALDILSKRF